MIDYEELLSRGIAASRAGKTEKARRYFGFAVRARAGDPRPWLWLCSVLDDPARQRDCLERALRADPTSLPARLLLTRLENLTPDELGLPDPPPLSAHAFDCSQCGGRLRYDPDAADLLCQHCGHHEHLQHADASDAERDLAGALESREAGGRALLGGELHCENCGARTRVAPQQMSLPCPFCGSRKVLARQLEEGMIEPHALAPFQFEAGDAYRKFRRWLAGHFFRPDDLTKLARTRSLRPVYLPVFTFDATVEVTYHAGFMKGGSLMNPDQVEWVQRSYHPRLEMDDLPVYASETVPEGAIKQVMPYDLKALTAYRPEYLADWPAEVYQLSLQDATLLARKRLRERGRREARQHAALRGTYRNFTITNVEIYRTSFKHVLLPVWIGAYRYKDRLFHVLVNGQNGKVAGEAPVDWVKVALVVAGVVGLLVLVAALAISLANS